MCPFELYAARHNDLWHLEIRNANHTFRNISRHPIARKLTETFAAMTVAGSRPRNFINRFNEWRSKI
ncbi:unnamed protein product [Rhizophagus irregularis]|nr:unnamed protein product [Rhizophagus irregularis]